MLGLFVVELHLVYVPAYPPFLSCSSLAHCGPNGPFGPQCGLSPACRYGGEIYEGGAKRLARILPRLLLHPLARPVAPRCLSVADTMQDRAGWPRWGRGFGVAGPVAHIVAPYAVPVIYYR